ncbi:MAG: hypothetical protein HQK72_10365 [Desulfamplus sp.]|nr:hypothetical protein [Desulfamplus sp.]
MRKLSKILITIFLLVNITTQFSNYGLIDNFIYANESKYSFSKLRLSGYGTISHTFDDNDDIMAFRDISRSMAKSNNVLKDNSTWRLDSRLGIQADYRFSQQAEFVIQGILKDRANPTFMDSIELAYLGLKPKPEIDIRAGRISYDAFLMSDIRDTGYTYIWVRPPVEFYSRIPIFFIDGVDLAYNLNCNDVQWRFKIQQGIKTLPLAMGQENYDFKSNNISSCSITRNSGALRLKAGYSFFTSKNEVNAFSEIGKYLEDIASKTEQTFPNISSEALSLRNDIRFKDNDISYITLGASYDDSKWLAQCEISLMRANGDVLPNGYAGYFSVGYRLGNFTPYFLFGKIEPYTDTHEPINNWGDWSSLQSTALYILNSTRMEQYSNSFGLRWDFNNQAAIKVQWDNIHVEPYGYGLLNRNIEFVPYSKSVNLYSLSLEFVF